MEEYETQHPEEFYQERKELTKEFLSEYIKTMCEQHPEKRKSILSVIENIKQYEERTGKIILDGIGLQSHYDLQVTPDKSKLFIMILLILVKKFKLQKQILCLE